MPTHSAASDVPAKCRFADALARGPILLDAAMGTRLIAQGLELGKDDPCLWNLDRADAVLAIHQSDVDAGSDALLTNTFGADTETLGRYDRADCVPAVIKEGVRLARQAAGPDRYVIGSIGPAGALDPPSYRQQVALLAEAGIDALLFETHRPEDVVRLALPCLRGLTALPILVSVADEDRLTSERVDRLMSLGVAAVGANCRTGVEPYLRMAERLHLTCPGVPLLVKPAASWPRGLEVSPAEFARAVPELVKFGVRLVGGCCGSTAAHIAALRGALDAAALARPRETTSSCRPDRV